MGTFYPKREKETEICDISIPQCKTANLVMVPKGLAQVVCNQITVLETTGVPVTGGPPMLMSKAVYYNWRSIYSRQTKKLPPPLFICKF